MTALKHTEFERLEDGRREQAGQGRPVFSCVRGELAPRSTSNQCLGPLCKLARNTKSKQYRDQPHVREALKKKYKEWHLKKDARLALLASAKHRAKVAGLPFNLNLNDIEIPERCPILGMKLSKGAGAPHDASPTVDKLIPKNGYVRGNVWVISKLANTMKNSAKPEQLRRFAKWAIEATGSDSIRLVF